jgi:hypothetical protein
MYAVVHARSLFLLFDDGSSDYISLNYGMINELIKSTEKVAERKCGVVKVSNELKMMRKERVV